MSDSKVSASSELVDQPIPFSPDFVERVLREAKRRRSNSRRTRMFALGAVLVAALTVVGRGPMHLRLARPAPARATLLAVTDWELADSALPGESAEEEDADADPGTYLAPDTPGQAEGQASDSDDSDLAGLGQN